ncbi:hypothetical protein D3C87_1722760 [compost metagenome]
MEVRDPADGAELLQQEEDHAVVDHAAPVAPGDEVALLGGEVGFVERGRRIGPETLAERRQHQLVQVAVDAVGAHAGFQRERVGAFQLLDAA